MSPNSFNFCCLGVRVILASLLSAAGTVPLAFANEGRLEAVLGQGPHTQVIKTWTLAQLRGAKQIASQEKEPGAAGKVVRWRGVRLFDLVEQALETVPVERRAQVDLVVVKGSGGTQALIPRALLVKYPVLLALSKGKEELKAGQTVVPWTSQPKIRREPLVLERFFVSDVARIEFANARDYFADLFLKRRTDPAAMRGEKIFVQSCTSCHSRGPLSIDALAEEKRVRSLASAGHPAIDGAPRLSERDKRAVESYLDAYRLENPRQTTIQASKP